MQKQILALILLIAPLSLALGQAAMPVRVGYIHFPPIFSTNPKGEPEGEAIELTKAVLNELGVPFLFYERPTKRMAHEIKTGELDLWVGLPYLPEFEGTTYISKLRLLKINLMIYWKKGTPPIKKIEELEDKSVVLLNGYSYGGQAKFLQNRKREQGTDLQVKHNCYAENHQQALMLVKMDHCDYLLDYDTPTDLTLQIFPLDLERTAVSSIEARFVVSKKNPRGKKLLEDLEDSYLRLIKEGKLKAYE